MKKNPLEPLSKEELEKIGKKLGKLKKLDFEKKPKPNRSMNTLEDILKLSNQLHHVKIDELEFLYKLDKKLHYIKQIKKPMPLVHNILSYTEWAQNPYGDCDEYNEKIMGLREYKKFAIIIERGIANRELVLYPINANLGFSVGFSVDAVPNSLYPGIEQEKKELVVFLEKQLPNGYGFEELSRLFKNPINREILKLCGLPRIRSRNYYNY